MTDDQKRFLLTEARRALLILVNITEVMLGISPTTQELHKRDKCLYLNK